MRIKRLGVNIDHVATIRNARGEKYPDPLEAALFSEKNGANSITIHLREDRRHIKDFDLKRIKKKLKIPLNLEMAPTNEMINIALKNKPKNICIVPEKRTEITTEGGLNLYKKKFFLKTMIKKLTKENISVDLAKKIGADCVELHTGKYCNLFNKKKNTKTEFLKIKKAAKYAHEIGLNVHAGHGLTYHSAKTISRIKHISEFNIGHFIISESIFFGLKKVVQKFKRIINS